MAISKRIGSFTEADVDDEVIVMRLDTGELFALAGTAAAIWRLIDGQRDREALRAALAEEYDAGSQEIGDDLDHLIEQLKDAGLVGE